MRQGTGEEFRSCREHDRESLHINSKRAVPKKDLPVICDLCPHIHLLQAESLESPGEKCRQSVTNKCTVPTQKRGAGCTVTDKQSRLCAQRLYLCSEKPDPIYCLVRKDGCHFVQIGKSEYLTTQGNSSPTLHTHINT